MPWHVSIDRSASTYILIYYFRLRECACCLRADYVMGEQVAVGATSRKSCKQEANVSSLLTVTEELTKAKMVDINACLVCCLVTLFFSNTLT